MEFTLCRQKKDFFTLYVAVKMMTRLIFVNVAAEEIEMKLQYKT
jgi:hypothetical protein